MYPSSSRVRPVLPPSQPEIPIIRNEAEALLSSPAFAAAKADLLQTILAAASRVRHLKTQPCSSEARAAYSEALDAYVLDRGAEPFFRFLSSGLGAGPFVELMDGTVKYDLMTGIGINFFGHSHPDLISEMVDALSSDVMQGVLEPGQECATLLRALLARAESCSRLAHGWITSAGTLANDVALKIIRQRHAPATKVLTFRSTFSGRSIAMQEISDNAKYREGQPVYGEVEYLPFFDPRQGLEGSIQATLAALREQLERYPGKFAAFVTELVQGEGGYRSAPPEFFSTVLMEAKKAGMAIWIDEVQTFGRTGQLFAFQTLGLGQLIDVVTIGKMLQVCATLYTAEYNPRPGLLSATFTGSSAALRVARRVIELLEEGGYYGPGGRIDRLSTRLVSNLQRIARSRPGMITEIRSLGGMIAFAPLDGSLGQVKAVLMRLFDLGVVAFYCGHGPHLIRMLPPFGAMTESEVDEACRIIETAILDVKAERQPGGS